MESEQKAKRIRGRKWMAMRREVFAAEPFCRLCAKAGKLHRAYELDHIVPLHKGGDAIALQNLQPLCRECHKDKTAKDMGHRGSVEIGADGWPI